jgi:hypothetical protein
LIPAEENPFKSLGLTEIAAKVEKESMLRLYELSKVNKWDSMLLTYCKLFKVWQMPCDSAFLIAGTKEDFL